MPSSDKISVIMSLAKQRRAIRHLLDENNPQDGMAVKYAFYHPDDKTTLMPFPADAGRALGYVAVCRTGMDLFRPLVTMRLPITDMDASLAGIYAALTPGMPVILAAPSRYLPLLKALFDVTVEEHLRIFVLDRQRFQPTINVLVTQSVGGNRLPRFVVRQTGGDDVAASAGLNWQSPHFADISVTVDPRYQQRGWGRSVVSAMIQHVLANGRTPLYVAAEDNQASVNLAHSLGFRDSGASEVMMQATLHPRP